LNSEVRLFHVWLPWRALNFIGNFAHHVVLSRWLLNEAQALHLDDLCFGRPAR
jgi:hypothetical protein